MPLFQFTLCTKTTSFDANPCHRVKTSRIFVSLIPHKSKSDIEPLRMSSMLAFAVEMSDPWTHILSHSPVCSSTYRKRNGLISAVRARRERRRSTSGWSSTAMMTLTMVQEQRKKRWRGLKWSKTFTRLCRATGLKRMASSYVRSRASILGATASRYMKCYTLLPLRTSFRKQ